MPYQIQLNAINKQRDDGTYICNGGFILSLNLYGETYATPHALPPKNEWSTSKIFRLNPSTPVGSPYTLETKCYDKAGTLKDHARREGVTQAAKLSRVTATAYGPNQTDYPVDCAEITVLKGKRPCVDDYPTENFLGF